MPKITIIGARQSGRRSPGFYGLAAQELEGAARGVECRNSLVGGYHWLSLWQYSNFLS